MFNVLDTSVSRHLLTNGHSRVAVASHTGTGELSIGGDENKPSCQKHVVLRGRREGRDAQSHHTPRCHGVNPGPAVSVSVVIAVNEGQPAASGQQRESRRGRGNCGFTSHPACARERERERAGPPFSACPAVPSRAVNRQSLAAVPTRRSIGSLLSPRTPCTFSFLSPRAVKFVLSIDPGELIVRAADFFFFLACGLVL